MMEMMDEAKSAMTAGNEFRETREAREMEETREAREMEETRETRDMEETKVPGVMEEAREFGEFEEARDTREFRELKDIKKEHYDIADLLALMRFLRSEAGCPWDREQTHQSIRSNVVEEAFEVVDAIDSGSSERLSDELGDLLLQVVFHSQMADEARTFNFDDVVRTICDKLISRHTHLFGEDAGQAGSAESVLALWERNKTKEKNHTRPSQAMKDIPRGFPALMRAYKIQKKAARVGFDWRETDDVAAKVEEEFAEVRSAKHAEEVENEIGDLFFALVNYARFLHVDPEMALDKANTKFIRRFEAMEDKVFASGQVMEGLDLTVMDAFWNEVKVDERKAGR
jgi:tetrapyrrole methylase family protein / MazG family protein